MIKSVLMWIQWLKCMIGFYLNCWTKNITVVDRPLNEWMADNILALKAIRRKNESIWRKTSITTNFNIYYDSCMAVKKAISIRKAELMEQRVINCEGD